MSKPNRPQLRVTAASSKSKPLWPGNTALVSPGLTKRTKDIEDNYIIWFGFKPLSPVQVVIHSPASALQHFYTPSTLHQEPGRCSSWSIFNVSKHCLTLAGKILTTQTGTKQIIWKLWFAVWVCYFLLPFPKCFVLKTPNAPVPPDKLTRLCSIRMLHHDSKCWLPGQCLIGTMPSQYRVKATSSIQDNDQLSFGDDSTQHELGWLQQGSLEFHKGMKVKSMKVCDQELMLKLKRKASRLALFQNFLYRPQFFQNFLLPTTSSSRFSRISFLRLSWYLQKNVLEVWIQLFLLLISILARAGEALHFALHLPTKVKTFCIMVGMGQNCAHKHSFEENSAIYMRFVFYLCFSGARISERLLWESVVDCKRKSISFSKGGEMS